METPLLQAMVLAPGLRGTWMGPQSPSSAATLLLHESRVGLELAEGPQALVDALLADCRKRGVELRPGSVVRRIRVERGAVVGLELADGSVDASTVLSSIGPRRTLLELVEARQVPDSLHREVSCIRVRGTLARVSFGLKDRPEFRCRPDLEVTAAHVGDSPIALEKGFDHAKHRRMPKSPPLDIRVFPSDGGWVVSCLLRSAAFDLDGGWSPQRHQELGDEVAASLEGVILGFRDSVVAREVLTPADLARRYGLEGGHEMHGELGLDQLHVLRPSRRLARYRSGIDGLWLGSSGCHPGGGVTGRPGLLSARALLRG
ncbi:MAG: hypothetical protein VX498_04175 [Myxococcota bacterium]|nr:hypothetical protein [Myxococcota bacterium]